MLALLVESWIWWSLVILVAASRFISRRMTLGSFRAYQADDYLMMLALCFYTTLIPTIDIVRHTSSNLLPPGFDVNSLTQKDIKEREYGSKLILVVEQCQCATIWLVKGCLVTLYLRLTTARWENRAIKVLAAYVVITFIVMDSLYFGYWCQPFHNYWAVPTPNPQCDAATHHLILNAVFNLSSDCAMMAIGLPMFLRMKLPLKKKIPLIGVFSLGVFTMVAAILNKVYSFTQPFGSQWTFWYTRESSTALLVANLPFIWTLWRRVISGHGSIHETSRQNSRTLQRNQNSTLNGISVRKGRFAEDDLELDLKMTGVGGSKEGGDMTLAEILGDSPMKSVDEQEVNELTHPYLFYARKKNNGVGVKSDPDLALPTEDSVPPTNWQESANRSRTDEPRRTSDNPTLEPQKSTKSLV